MIAATDLAPILQEISARLARLESAAKSPAVEPLRVSKKQAAAMLGVSERQVSRLAARGLLVRLPKRPGAGRSTPTYFDPANVRALAVSEDTARQWIAARRFVPHGRRPK